MIYEKVTPTEGLRQGDILYPVPMLVPQSLAVMPTLQPGQNQTLPLSWTGGMEMKEAVLTVPVIPVWGIVATQDCDAERADLISCFAINGFKNVTGTDLKEKLPKSRLGPIIQDQRKSGKWLYMPPDEAYGIPEPMAIDLQTIFQLDRESLVAYLEKLRVGRLNSVAYEHYRETIAQYFRKYPYQEWYPLSKDELVEYRKKCPNTPAFPWQSD